MAAAPEAAPEVGTIHFYDEMWQRYGHLDAASPAAFHRRRLIVELCARHAPAAARVLSIGCGRGELARDLRVAFPHAGPTASDVSLASVQEAQRLDASLQVLQMDLEHPNFDLVYSAHLGRFELITCPEVVEHIRDDLRALRRLTRLLARFDRLIGHHRHYTSGSLLELALVAEFDPLDLLAWGFPFRICIGAPCARRRA